MLFFSPLQNSLNSVSVHHFSLATQDTPVTIMYPDLPQTPQQGVEPSVSLINQHLRPHQVIWQKFFGLPSKTSQLRVLSETAVGTGSYEVIGGGAFS